MDANENSIGPAIITEDSMNLSLNRYPDPFHLDIKEKVQFFNIQINLSIIFQTVFILYYIILFYQFCKLRKNVIKKDQVFFGVGSDEAIDILFRIFCIPREDNVLITPPTYGKY